MFYLATHSTHFIYGYITSDIWQMTTQIVREETHCRHIGYAFRLAARVLLYAHPTYRLAHTTSFVSPVVKYYSNEKQLNGSTMKDWSDNPSHHERTLYHMISEATGFSFDSITLNQLS